VPVFRMPRKLEPVGFKNVETQWKKRPVTLYRAESVGRKPRIDLPKIPPGNARLDVEALFGALYYSEDSTTAREEFRYRNPDDSPEVWRVESVLERVLDLTNPGVRESLGIDDNFLREDHFFPWQYIAAGCLAAGIEGIRYRSFRWDGINWGIVALHGSSTVKVLEEAD